MERMLVFWPNMPVITPRWGVSGSPLKNHLMFRGGSPFVTRHANWTVSSELAGPSKSKGVMYGNTENLFRLLKIIIYVYEIFLNKSPFVKPK